MTLSPDNLCPETLAELETSLHQIKAANYFLRVALDEVSEGVLIIEPQKNTASGYQILFSNAAAALMAGVEINRGLRGMALHDLTVTDDEAARLHHSLHLAAENGSHECDGQIQNFRGREPQRCRWRVRAVFNSLRKLLNYTLWITPLTDGAISANRKSYPTSKPEDLDEHSDQLKKDNLAALAQGIAHDVNNLLGPVTMRLSDLMQNITDPKLQEELQHIFGGLARARQFTSQVVSACKARPQDKKPVNLTPLIKDTVKFASAGSNVRVNTHLAPDLLWPLADGTKISQVLQNLILNGIQAMPRGGHLDVEAKNTEISTGQDAVLAAGSYVQIVVRDRGCGIAPENLDRLFRESFSTKADGNGIGLTTCKRFIQDHKGDIRVVSRLHIGTQFTVLLPALPAPSTDQKQDLASQNATVLDAPPVPLKHGRGRVLIVDDEDDLRKVARMILARCGYEVFEADNGQDAVKTYQTLFRQGMTPDVVLMDLTLRGGMDGSETAEQLLRLDPEVRLVVTSGSVNSDVQLSYLQRGFLAVLPKPYEAGELTQMVHRVITLTPH